MFQSQVVLIIFREYCLLFLHEIVRANTKRIYRLTFHDYFYFFDPLLQTKNLRCSLVLHEKTHYLA